jgi:hypothetical protein
VQLIIKLVHLHFEVEVEVEVKWMHKNMTASVTSSLGQLVYRQSSHKVPGIDSSGQCAIQIQLDLILVGLLQQQNATKLLASAHV